MISYDDETAFADQPEAPTVVLSLAYIERLEKRMRDAAQISSRLAIHLTAALSAVRKDAVGYRIHNTANPDGGQNAKPGDLLRAAHRAETYLEAHHQILRQLGWPEP